MTEVTPNPRRWVRLGSLIAALVVLVAGGVTAVTLLSKDRGTPSASGSATPAPSPSASPDASPSPLPGADLRGPLNILLVGVDTRVEVPGWQPHGDAVLVMHIAQDLRRAYLFSLPRDTYLKIPAFPPAQFPGQRTKLTHAMSYGSRVPGTKQPNPAQGLQLMAKTVSAYTGIAKFDAAAVLNFGGLTKLVDALGGVDLYIDQRVVSKHRQPDGKSRPLRGGTYTGPQMVYEKGQRHLTGWQALDYARQRYITGGDYARQRHQRQLIKAIMRQVFSRDVVTDPVKLDAVLRAVGKALLFDGRGHGVVDFAFALGSLRPESVVLVGLPGGGVSSGGTYRGERLDPVATQFFAAVRADRVDAFLASHPTLVNKG